MRACVYEFKDARIQYTHTHTHTHSNILLNSDCRLKLCDFNLSRDMGVEPTEDEDTLTEYVVSRWYRAPEVILCSARYNSKIDLWAVGCIMIELQTRNAFFRGDDCLGQLNAIFKVCGTPSREDLLSCCVGNEDAADLVQRLPKYDPVKLSHVLPQCGAEELDLIGKLLHINPNKRLSAEEALRHPFLEKYVRDTPECKDRFSFNPPSRKNKQVRARVCVRVCVNV
jgi:serine/threonine protein kinase